MKDILKTSLSILALMLFLNAYPQVTSQRTLQLTGQSLLKITPNQANIAVSISAKENTLGETIKKMELETSKVIKRIKTLGFAKEDIKTSNYNVRESTIYRDRKRVKDGYIASQNISLFFPYNAKKLDNFLIAFNDSEENVNLNFSFSVSEEKNKKIKDELIKLAVKDAKIKAKIIAEASNVTLDNIINISYKTNDTRHNSPQYYSNRTLGVESLSSDKSSFSEMELKEIQMSDQVVIQWKIK